MPYIRKSRADLAQMTLDDLTVRKRALEIIFTAIRNRDSALPRGHPRSQEWTDIVAEINDATILIVEKSLDA
jgi:hypothetical protein